MADLYKYATAVHLYKPIVKKGVVDFAVGADWTPAAGDVKISIDGGAAANVTNLPSAIVMGNTALWDYSLTAAELTGKKIRITVADSATKAVEDTAFEIDTYGSTSGQHAVDLTDGVRMGMTALPPDARVTGTVDTGAFAPTATDFESSLTEATASHYLGLSCFASSGALAGQLLGVVTAYSLIGGRGHFTVSGSPSGESMANGNSFYLV